MPVAGKANGDLRCNLTVARSFDACVGLDPNAQDGDVPETQKQAGVSIHILLAWNVAKPPDWRWSNVSSSIIMTDRLGQRSLRGKCLLRRRSCIIIHVRSRVSRFLHDEVR